MLTRFGQARKFENQLARILQEYLGFQEGGIVGHERFEDSVDPSLAVTMRQSLVQESPHDFSAVLTAIYLSESFTPTLRDAVESTHNRNKGTTGVWLPSLTALHS
jgi:hypothetical protein